MMAFAFATFGTSTSDHPKEQEQPRQVVSSFSNGIDQILGFAQRFEELEKQKLNLKKRKLAVMECYQNEMMNLEKEKNEIEREKNDIKRIKLALLESQTMRSRYDLWQRELSVIHGVKKSIRVLSNS